MLSFYYNILKLEKSNYWQSRCLLSSYALFQHDVINDNAGLPDDEMQVLYSCCVASSEEVYSQTGPYVHPAKSKTPVSNQILCIWSY